jgi:lipoate synthase
MDVSPEQIEKSRRTIRAAGVFAENSERIVAHVQALPVEHVVVAVVTRDYVFDGVHHVSRQELVERVPELEGPGGWAMVFSPGADADHVSERTATMIELAEKRIEMISRIASRRQ